MSRQQGLSSYSDVDTSVIEKLYVFTVCLTLSRRLCFLNVTKSKRFFLSVLQLNTIFSAHISSFKMIWKPSNSLPSEFSKVFVLALKIVQKRRYTNLTFGHVFLFELFCYIFKFPIVKYLKISEELSLSISE